ncbi:MAG: P-loop NTPase [Nitrospirae bacterium]|nr:P-loop NTPase [Nitrospirota bacterium]
MEKTDLKDILSRLAYPDEARIVQQVGEQMDRVKSRLAPIRRKILVMSGKGGVGKSMVTANLALSFARRGWKTGILDVDLNGPCIPRMLGIQGGRLKMTPEGAVPPEGPLGIKVASMEFFLPKENPLQWKGPAASSPVWLGATEMSVIREFLADVLWGELDLLLLDLPPGAAADKPPLLAGLIPDLNGAVVVTTPSAVAADVVKRSIHYAREMGIRVIGLVENMSGFVCPECHAESDLFEGPGEKGWEETGVPLLGRVPFDRAIGRACDRGNPLMEGAEPSVRRFGEITDRIVEVLS